MRQRGKILLDNWEFEPVANVLVALGSGVAGPGVHAEVNVGPVACLGARRGGSGSTAAAWHGPIASTSAGKAEGKADLFVGLGRIRFGEVLEGWY